MINNVNAIDTETPSTRRMLIKQQYDSDNNTKITESKNKIPSFTDLEATAALNTKSDGTESKYLILLMGLQKLL